MTDALQQRITELEKLVYVPGLWKCPKCNFQLMQANLNAWDGSVTARDTPGDKCPNCDTPLWRVTERQAGNELVVRCEEQVERAVKAETTLLRSNAALRTAITHIDHMAAWITARNAGAAKTLASVYSFESLGEDMPGIRAALEPQP